jgi:type IV pilus assembly protein PilW
MDKGKDKRRLSQRRIGGFSLVELLVAAAITLIGLLVIAQVFAAYEGWKRTTTGVAQTLEGGLLGAFSIEQDLRHAGFGMFGFEMNSSSEVIRLGCSKINAYNANATPQNFTIDAIPVSIETDIASNSVPAKRSDKIHVLYGTSPLGNVAATLQTDLIDAQSVLNIDNGFGFTSGDLVVISPQAPPQQPCSILQITGVAGPGVPNIYGPGTSTSWNLKTNPSPWNPAGSSTIFPAGGYTKGSKVFNLGQLVDHTFNVKDNMLFLTEIDSVVGPVPSYGLVPGVVGLHAEILPGSNPPVAIRFALIVRSDNWEKEPVSPATIDYWPGGPTFSVNADEQHYRHRVFQTIVPLKNILWNR